MKTTDLSLVTDKLYHIMLYASPWSRFELTTSVVIGTDCICSDKCNYHAFTATTVPENTKWVIRHGKSKDLQHNYQSKKHKKIEKHEPHGLTHVFVKVVIFFDMINWIEL